MRPHHHHYHPFPLYTSTLHPPPLPPFCLHSAATSLALRLPNLSWKWGKMIIMGLLEKHKVKMTPNPPSPHSHLGWRRWDACATNHLYTLISANDPRCCLLLSEQMTLRKNWEGRMKRWAGGMRKEEWSAWDGMGWGGGWGCNLPAYRSWNWEGNCARHMSSSAKGGFYCTRRCVCVRFLLQNEASGMFIESP